MAAWTKVVLEGDITGTSPIAVQGSALSLSVSGLPDAGVPANSDKILSWNGTQWETVDAEEFLGGSGVSVTINNNGDNKIITGSDTSQTLNAESNLTYSTNLEIASGDIRMTTNNKYLQGALANSSIRPLIGFNSSDEVVVGNGTSNAISLVGLTKAENGIYRILTSTSGISNSGDFGIGAEIIRYGSTATTAGRVYYLNTGGSWSAADNGQASSGTTLLGIAAGTNSGSDGMIIRGMVRPSSILNSPSVGEPVFLGATGSFDANAPTTTGDIKRVVGHLVTNGIIYFNPSPTWEVV